MKDVSVVYYNRDLEVKRKQSTFKVEDWSLQKKFHLRGREAWKLTHPNKLYLSISLTLFLKLKGVAVLFEKFSHIIISHHVGVLGNEIVIWENAKAHGH